MDTRHFCQVTPCRGGATFRGILDYVMKHSRITETDARRGIIDVLKVGLSLGKIKKTGGGTYVLMVMRPAPIVHKIREPRLSDDSDGNTSSCSSD